MAGEKVKVIIKRPDEKVGHVTNISTRIENLQKTVEGYIESINIEKDIYIICNEEGRLKMLDGNMWVRMPGVMEYLVGTIIVCRVNKDGDIVDLPDKYLKHWKELLWQWGNDF